jgi:N-methylhydantoinase B
VGAHFLVDAGKQTTELPGKITFSLAPDHMVVVQTPGGGGWGNPEDRPPDAIAADWLDEKM